MEHGLSLQELVKAAIIAGWTVGCLLLILGSAAARRLLPWMLLWTFLVPFLPFWGHAAFAVVAALLVLQGFGTLLFGKEAADAMIGNLLTDLVKFLFQSLVRPLRLLAKLLRHRL